MSLILVIKMVHTSQFLRSAHGKFVDVSTETFIKVFLVLSLTYELTNIRNQLSSKLSSPQHLFDVKKLKTSSYLSKEKNIT